jgi:hypothetical protein
MTGSIVLGQSALFTFGGNMIDMKEFISDLWLDKWIDNPVVKYLQVQADEVQWSPKVTRQLISADSSEELENNESKVIELVDINPTILRFPARYHNGVVVMYEGKTRLRLARYSSVKGEVLLDQNLFEDPHSPTQEDMLMLEMTHPEIFAYAPLFNLVVSSAINEATWLLTKEGKL